MCCCIPLRLFIFAAPTTSSAPLAFAIFAIFSFSRFQFCMNIFTAACVVVFLQFFIDVLIKLLAFLPLLPLFPLSILRLQLQWRADAHVERLSLSLSCLLACANCSCTKNVLIFICKNLSSPLSPSLLSPSVPALVRFPPFCICCFYYFWHDMKISLENNLLWLWVLVAICSGYPRPPFSPPLSLFLLPLLVCFLLLFFYCLFALICCLCGQTLQAF